MLNNGIFDVRKTIGDVGGLLEGAYFIALKKKPNISTKYVNIDPLLSHPPLMLKVGGLLVKQWEGFDTIAAPAVGGIPVAYAAALSLYTSTGKKARVVWADKSGNGDFALERMGFAEAVRGKRVLVVEDVTSTGSSTKAVCDLVTECGGRLVGASVIWNRGGVSQRDIGAPKLTSLVSEQIKTWEAGKHEKWGIWPLVTDVGHPDHFPDYPGPRVKILK